ncbi:hypothetical protein [Desulfonatronovibrio hydrogenovorans]|uniref:hypothetical protein n=1 Tax=Desulfonatronovibrio hydrogenovorans TaxID=53245 RepID=UPI000491D4E9|nr:hypothetical protein [Desulfonatronovibrio hydrogenovorans]
MESKIFNLGLSVEAISLYLILFDLDFSKVSLEMENIEPRWNAPRDLLEKAVDELEMNRVISKKGQALAINPAAVWTETKSA